MVQRFPERLGTIDKKCNQLHDDFYPIRIITIVEKGPNAFLWVNDEDATLENLHIPSVSELTQRCNVSLKGPQHHVVLGDLSPEDRAKLSGDRRSRSMSSRPLRDSSLSYGAGQSIRRLESPSPLAYLNRGSAVGGQLGARLQSATTAAPNMVQSEKAIPSAEDFDFSMLFNTGNGSEGDPFSAPTQHGNGNSFIDSPYHYNGIYNPYTPSDDVHGEVLAESRLDNSRNDTPNTILDHHSTSTGIDVDNEEHDHCARRRKRGEESEMISSTNRKRSRSQYGRYKMD